MDSLCQWNRWFRNHSGWQEAKAARCACARTLKLHLPVPVFGHAFRVIGVMA
jgi:hypothetical protein